MLLFGWYQGVEAKDQGKITYWITVQCVHCNVKRNNKLISFLQELWDLRRNRIKCHLYEVCTLSWSDRCVCLVVKESLFGDSWYWCNWYFGCWKDCKLVLIFSYIFQGKLFACSSRLICRDIGKVCIARSCPGEEMMRTSEVKHMPVLLKNPLHFPRMNFSLFQIGYCRSSGIREVQRWRKQHLCQTNFCHSKFGRSDGCLTPRGKLIHLPCHKTNKQTKLHQKITIKKPQQMFKLLLTSQFLSHYFRYFILQCCLKNSFGTKLKHYSFLALM